MEKCAQLLGKATNFKRVRVSNGNIVVVEKIQVGGRRLVPILKEILPYLIIKKENAKQIIEYHEVDHRGKKRIQPDGSIQYEPRRPLTITVRFGENEKEYRRQYRIQRRVEIREMRRRYCSLHRERIRQQNALSYRRRVMRRTTALSDVSNVSPVSPSPLATP